MIWLVRGIDPAFIAKLSPAGSPDRMVIETFLKNTRVPIHLQKNPEEQRWYYLLRDNPAISLTAVGQPLDTWQGSAKLIIGTREIIGEFPKTETSPGNRDLTGLRGIQIKFEVGSHMRGQPDRTFEVASEIFSVLSEQVLDTEKIEKSQRQIKQKYRWKN